MENTQPIQTKNTWPPLREIIITLILQVIIIANVAFLGYSYGVNRRVSAPTPGEIQKQLPPTQEPSQEGPRVCPRDVKQCPDGSGVIRIGPNCEFAACPGESAMPGACTMDAKQCPDGSYVGRSGPACEFAKCPIGTPLPVALPPMPTAK